jgi:hypothetical protein
MLGLSQSRYGMLPLEIVETGAALTWSFYTIPAINLHNSAPIVNVRPAMSCNGDDGAISNWSSTGWKPCQSCQDYARWQLLATDAWT